MSATALVAVVLWTGAACGEGDEGAVSSDQIQRDVFRADLKSGSTGEAAARIVRQFAGMEGVRGTRGDDGNHVWISGTTDATPEQVDAIEQQVNDLSAVASVPQLR